MEPKSVFLIIGLLAPKSYNEVTVHFIPRYWLPRLWYNMKEKSRIPYDPRPYESTGIPRTNDGSVLTITDHHGTRTFLAEQIVSITEPVGMLAVGDGGALISVSQQ